MQDSRVDLAAARELTRQIREATENLWGLIVRAYQTKAWKTLGYPSWDAYVTKELGDLKIRLPKEDRREITKTLHDHGLSLRAISSVTGYDKHTVSRDLEIANSESGAFAPPSIELPAQRRGPRSGQRVTGNNHARRAVDPFWKAITDLAKIGDRLSKLSGNSGFEAETERVKEVSLQDLQRAREVLDRVIARLEGVSS